MIFNQTTKERIYQLLDTNKRVRTMNVTQNQVSRYLDTVNAINSVPYDVSNVGQNVISDYKIADFLEFLLVPRSIRLEGLSACEELRCNNYYSATPVDIMTPTEFNDMSTLINGNYKRTPSLIPCDKYNSKIYTLADYAKATLVNDHVLTAELTMLPLVLHVNFYREPLYCENVNEALRNLILTNLNK